MSITIIAPEQATPGQKVFVKAIVQNYSEVAGYFTATGKIAYGGVTYLITFLPTYEWLEPYIYTEFVAEFIMPNTPVQGFAWSWLWTTDWVEEQMKEFSVVLAQAAPAEFSSLTAAFNG